MTLVTYRCFDEMIGRLDRLLSEFLIEAKTCRNEADRQTLKHHADDLIGVGKKTFELLAASEPGSRARPKTGRRRSGAKGKRRARQSR